LRSKRFTLADAEQTNSIFVADLRFAEQKKYLRLPALVTGTESGRELFKGSKNAATAL